MTVVVFAVGFAAGYFAPSVVAKVKAYVAAKTAK